MKIKLTKINECENPILKSASLEEYVPGDCVDETKSIPIEWWLIGRLMEPIDVDKSILIERTIRNGVGAYGIFKSSPVKEIVSDTRVETENSIYDIEWLDPL